MKLTDEQHDQIGDLLCAADGGLPKRLGDFIRIVCRSIRLMDTIDAFESTQEIQQHLDTLINLIDVKVNSGL